MGHGAGRGVPVTDRRPDDGATTAPARTVGASDVAAILGLSPWRRPYDVWWALAADDSERYPAPSSGALLRGQLLEPGLREWYARAEGVPDLRPGPTLAEPGWPVGRYGHARPDAYHAHPDGGGGIVVVEVKTARSPAEWAEGVPAHYLAQVLWQLASVPPGGASIAEARVVAYVLDDAPRIYHVARDPRREAALLRRVEEWYECHVIGGVPPLDGDADRAAWFAIQPTRDVWVECDATTRDTLAQWRDVRRRIRALDAEREAIEAALKARIGDASGIRGEVAWTYVRGRATVDVRALRADMPDVAARYTRTGSPSRRLRDLSPSSVGDGDDRGENA